MRGRGKNNKSVHALARTKRVAPGASRQIEFRLQKLMSDSQLHLPSMYSTTNAQTLIDSLDRWAQGLQKELPQSIFSKLPAPANTYSSYTAEENKWLQSVLSATKIDPQYPATPIAARAEIRSWILNPRTQTTVEKDLTFAVKWQVEHLKYLKEALRKSPVRHKAWGLYGLLAKQGYGNKSKPRTEAIKMAQVELTRLQQMLTNYQASAPFLLGPCYQALNGDRWPLSVKAWEYAWEEARDGNIASMDELCTAWQLAQATGDILQPEILIGEVEEFKRAGKYFLYLSQNKMLRKRLWPHHKWQQEIDNETHPLIAGEGVEPLLKYIEPLGYSNYLNQVLPVENLYQAKQTANLFSQSSRCFGNRASQVVANKDPAEHYYTIPATEQAVVETLADDNASVDIYLTQHQLPKKDRANRQERVKKVWRVTARSTMRHQLPDGTFHTICLQTELGESKKRDQEKAQVEILAGKDWVQQNSNQALITINQTENLDSLPSVGYLKVAAAKDISGWGSYSLEKLEKIMAQKPVKQLQSLDQLLPKATCLHKNTKWIKHETTPNGQITLNRKHCLDCNHPRLDVRFAHQIKEIRAGLENSITAGHPSTRHLQEYNAYLLASGKRSKAYDSLKDLLDSESAID